MNSTALTLVIIGAINWLLVGLFEFDLVQAITMGYNGFSRFIYVLVGLAGLYAIKFFNFGCCDEKKKHHC